MLRKARRLLSRWMASQWQHCTHSINDLVGLMARTSSADSPVVKPIQVYATSYVIWLPIAQTTLRYDARSRRHNYLHRPRVGTSTRRVEDS